MQSSEHDHGYHAREKKNYDKRVENAKPLYVCVWHWLQDVVPSRWPFDGVIHLKQNKAPPNLPVLQLYYSTVQIPAKTWQFLNNCNSNRSKFSYRMQLYFKAFYTHSLFLNNCITKMTSTFVCMLLYSGTSGGMSVSWPHGKACLKAI